MNDPQVVGQSLSMFAAERSSEPPSAARLLSVNVGLPRDIEWNGRSVHTAIWKNPVTGRCRVGRLNLAGDGQGDLGGHGGEQRAVFVYQIESYRYWQGQLKRTDFVHGQFSENFTIDGLERALRIEALSPGWRSSFEALLHSQTTGAQSANAGLMPAAAAHPVAPGFRPLAVTAIDRESADVLSLTMQSPDGQPLQMALPGQYVVLRLERTVGGAPLFRSYSLSGPVS